LSFLPFLFFYSFQLTGIVLVFTFTIALVIGVLIVPFKRRLDALYEAEGSRQAMLVETINGMATVKAMAIEPLLRKQWENKVAKAVSACSSGWARSRSPPSRSPSFSSD
jgi:ATP-binding cassette, subfamily B, bacterial HlyB/CyaB